MNGINSLEINEIIFDDGTSITSNDFASSTDLTALASLVQTNTNKVGISSSQATAIANIQTITAGDGLAFDGDTLDAEVTSSLLNAKASNYDVVAPLVKTQREVVSFGENPIVLSIDYDLDALATAVGNNTAKTGITTAQANAIAANSNKTGITTSQANAITANSNKTGITTAQANAITANSNKTGISTAQANAITANSAKVSINPVTLISNMSQLVGNNSMGGRFDIDQVKVTTAQNTSAAGSSDAALLVESGVLLCNSNTARGYTGSNGVLQINSRNSGKLKDGAAFRTYNDGNKRRA